jgi:hypothetical protein
MELLVLYTKHFYNNLLKIIKTTEVFKYEYLLITLFNKKIKFY